MFGTTFVQPFLEMRSSMSIDKAVWERNLKTQGIDSYSCLYKKITFTIGPPSVPPVQCSNGISDRR